MVEVHVLPGYRAWGDSPDEAIEIISDMAVDSIWDEIAEGSCCNKN